MVAIGPLPPPRAARTSPRRRGPTPNAEGIGPAVSRASLKADLLAAQQRCIRMAARTQQLETRLSKFHGEQTWRESGLGTPTDIDQLKQQITALEQHVVDLRLQLEERGQDLAAGGRTSSRKGR